MGCFECCHHCTKRYLGCHSECPEYIADKKTWDGYMEAERKRRASEPLTLYNEKLAGRKRRF